MKVERGWNSEYQRKYQEIPQNEGHDPKAVGRVNRCFGAGDLQMGVRGNPRYHANLPPLPSPWDKRQRTAWLCRQNGRDK